MIESHKCPSCGASLAFDAEQSQVACDYCNAVFSPEEISSYHKTTNASKTEVQNTRGYHCENCGAEVVTDGETSSSFCYYCHSPVILTDRVSGDFTPDYILPFKISKEQAKERFLKWVSKFKLLPRDFKSPAHLEKITGIYVPYWMADATADIDVEGTGETQSVRISGDKRYTTIKTFKFKRAGKIDINHVKTLASNKVDQNLINSVESNTKEKLKDFSTAFLTGFFSQRYTISRQEVEQIMQRKIDNYITTLINNQIGAYSSIRFSKNQRRLQIKKWSYVLLPMWILTYQFKGKTYVYALNGETGEFFGELPLDKSKLVLRMVGGFIAILFAFVLGGHFIW